MRDTGIRTSRSIPIIVLAAGVLLLLLLAAGPALATQNGTQVWAGKDMAGAKWQGETQMAGNYVVWTQKDDIITGGGGYQYQVYLADLATGAFLQLHPDMAMEQHYAHVAVQDGLITVVWTEAYNDNGYRQHPWIWQGTEEAGTHFVPTPDPAIGDGVTSAFPRYLVKGTYDYSVDPAVPVETNQGAASIGLVAEPGADVAGDHLVVAWEDYRDFGQVPQVYYADLTVGLYPADSTTDLWATGTAVDYTDLLARGEYSPAVGAKGVFWLDDRYSIWTNQGEMLATDVRFSDFASGGPDMTVPSVALYNDVPSTDDNRGLIAAGAGAAWLHTGPYRNGAAEPFAAKVGGAAALLTTATIPQGDGALSSTAAGGYYALMARHGDSATGDEDIFFYDPATGARVPVCDRGQNSYPTDPTGFQRFANDAYQPAIALVPAATPGSYLPFERVVWSDGRVNTVDPPEEGGMTQLFEAFVPRVTIKAGSSLRSGVSLRLGKSTTISTTVAPNFAGFKATLQLVKATRPGIYTVLRSKYSSTKTLSSLSAASWTFKPTSKGTYLVRIYFGGGTRYYADGTLTAPVGGFSYQVPHVPNDSRLVKVVIH